MHTQLFYQVNKLTFLSNLVKLAQLLLITCLSTLLTEKGYSQTNLISNGSFEISNWSEPLRFFSGFKYGLDSSWTNNRFQENWIMYNGGGHAEIYSVNYNLNTPNAVGIPNPIYFTQDPPTGISYVGFSPFSTFQYPSKLRLEPGQAQMNSQTREYLQTKITREASTDSLYCFSTFSSNVF